VAETTGELEADVLEAEDAPSSYTTSTPEVRGGGASITAPGGATGRRKEAIARVRLIPGSGVWKINGRTLEDYFPNKVHQQLVNEPFRVTDTEGRFDVIARIHGGGTSGQAGALRLGIRPEYLRLQAASGPGALPATVRQVQDIGTYLLVTLEAAGQTLKARLPAEAEAPAVGAQLGAQLLGPHTCYYRNEELIA
jgi:ribosomal protein S9